MSISSFLQKKFLKSLFFPAHSRGKALPKELIKLLNLKPGEWDLPELPEIGSPLSSSGLISNAQNYFSELFNTKNCWFGVNGASGLIQSAILAMANPGDYILMPRNIHLCVIKTCILANIIPVFFDLQFSSESGHYLPIAAKWFAKVINDKSLKGIKLAGVVFVNPYYQGYVTDLDPLIKICHDKNLPVLVDEAHGSYFLFCEGFGLPKSAVRSKADLVVHSLHKSLNGLTQTAVLWHCGDKINEKKIKDSINLLQTTSPSALLLSSCEESILDWIGSESLNEYKNRILEARNIFRELIKRGIPLERTDDPLKIVLNTGRFGIDGFTADKFFYKYGLIAELPEFMTLTFCLGFSKQNDFIAVFEKLWNKLISDFQGNTLKSSKPPFEFIQIPEILPAEAWIGRSTQIPVANSVGRISADIVSPYPPGIPLLVPGERIDRKRVDWLLEQGLYCEDLENLTVSVLQLENNS